MTLKSLLEGELAQMGDFIKLLKEEQGALTAGDTEALEALSATKVALVQTLNRSGKPVTSCSEVRVWKTTARA